MIALSSPIVILINKLNNRYKGEISLLVFIYCIGHYPRISEELDKLYSEQCPEDRYQPEGAQSNKFKKVTCDYMKAKCNGLGEDYCNHGNLTVDSQCKCDYLRGYIALEYLLDNPLNKSCYSKKDAGRGCIMYTCTDPDKELNPGKCNGCPALYM